MKKGIVMEGGGMRGIFVAGVLDVLMENNIEFDGSVGVSAGACFGCNFKSKQIGRAVRTTATHCVKREYCSLYSLITTGDMFGAKYCYHEIPEVYDIFDHETYEANPHEFYIVCTDANTGEAVYKKCDKSGYETFEWIRASASLPLVSRTVKLDGKEYLDGGIVDSIPLKFFQGIGYNKNLVIVTQPEGYHKTKNSSMWLIKLLVRKYPRIIEAMSRRHIMYNETVDYIKSQEEKGEVFVIRPKETLPVGRIEKNPNKIIETYNIGRQVMEERISQLKEYLEI